MEITIDKYNNEIVKLLIGDVVYFMYNNEVKTANILKIEVSKVDIVILVSGNYGHRSIDKLFKTKQDLLNSL